MAASILLIDDDADDQLLFKEMISEIGSAAEFVTADNGFEGLQLLSEIQPPPSLIFLDLNMPLINGWECLQRIKLNDKMKVIPVVILTTSDNQRDKDQALRQGAKMFLTKTAEWSTLKQSIREVLKAEQLVD